MHLICLAETWSISDILYKPHFMDNYDVISTKATKMFNKGRGSGGLAIFIRRGIFKNVRSIISNDWCLGIILEYQGVTFVICNIYWRSGSEFDYLCDDITTIIYTFIFNFVIKCRLYFTYYTYYFLYSSCKNL